MKSGRHLASPLALAAAALIVCAAGQAAEEPGRAAGAALVHYLLASSAGAPLAANETQLGRILDEALDRVGPDMRPASGFEDSKDISLEVAKLAWRLMRRHAELVAGQRVGQAWPLVERSLREANVSDKCLGAAARTARAARELKAWAIQRK